MSVFIIAEAGVNHNGSLEMASKLVDVAVAAGADAVKFQTFKTENLVSRAAPKAEYQRKTTDPGETQFEMIKKLELDEDSHRILLNHCKKSGIQFLSTPFDHESVDLLAQKLDLSSLKIPSGEITNGPLLLHVAHSGKPIILSTGMSTIDEIEQALGVIAYGFVSKGKPPLRGEFRSAFSSEEGQAALKEKVTLLHCTSEYPAPFEDVNLKAMATMSEAFGLPVGLSDHTTGIAVSIAAVALGAAIIEKHFTLDRNLPGPDHRTSLEPDELRTLVRSIREVEVALGDGVKQPAKSELKNLAVVRKSLIARKDIRAGEVFTPSNLCVKRPGGGITPMCYWDFLGRTAIRDYHRDEKVDI